MVSLLCQHSTKPNSNSPEPYPEPDLFHRLRFQLKSPAPQHCSRHPSQCCESGSGWIRKFFLDPDPELFVSDPDPDEKEKEYR